MSFRLRARMTLLAAPVFLALFVSLANAQNGPATVAGQIAPKWTVPLPSAPCSWAPAGNNCHPSSPGIGDLNGDGRLDIIIATNNGHVVAVSNGTVLWDRDVAGLFNMPANSQSIGSSPAVGDLNNDGTLEVVVATSILDGTCKPGGVIVLDNQGHLWPNWPRLGDKTIGPIEDCPAPFFSTPALGDLDNNGDLEIVIGGMDKRIYAYHHTGELVAGFPPPSAHYERIGWSILRNRLADSIWSSPALADVNGDGQLDIFIGTDEGNYDDRHPGESGGWHCPYRLPPGWQEGYCGGSLYGLTGSGALLPGFPQYRLEIVQSTPALADVTGDGRPEVFVGTGVYYHNNSPDHPDYGKRMWAFDSQGRELPGWGGGRPTRDLLPGSPAIGDIAGDGAPEIIIATLKGDLYAWHHNGTLVSGFPMTPRSPFGDTDNHDVGKSVVLGDYDGDGKMEIFMTMGWTIGIIDGDGRMITKTNSNDASHPFYYTDGLLLNNPVLADVDGDGQLELVAHNSRLYVWDLPNGVARADWAMFKGNPARTGSQIAISTLALAPRDVVVGHASGLARHIRAVLTLRAPGATFDWRLSSGSAHISFPRQSGTATGAAEVVIVARVPDNLGVGHHSLGSVTVEVTGRGATIHNNHTTVPVSVDVIHGRPRARLPVVFRPR